MSSSAKSCLSWLALAVLASGLLIGCGARHELKTHQSMQPADSVAGMDMPLSGAGRSGMTHGNHNPKYGGVVLLDVDFPFEVVLKATAQYSIYFSDTARQELPATTVSNVRP